MIAKGLHFPHVTLVGIVSADTALVLPDFRSGGADVLARRPGRGARRARRGRRGASSSRRRCPDHPAIRFAAEHDYEAFAARGAGGPKDARLPAVAPAAAGRRARDRTRRPWRRASRRRRSGCAHARPRTSSVLGPAVPTVARIQERYRRHALVEVPAATRGGRGSSARCERRRGPSAASRRSGTWTRPGPLGSGSPSRTDGQAPQPETSAGGAGRKTRRQRAPVVTLGGGGAGGAGGSGATGPNRGAGAGGARGGPREAPGGGVGTHGRAPPEAGRGAARTGHARGRTAPRRRAAYAPLPAEGAEPL